MDRSGLLNEQNLLFPGQLEGLRVTTGITATLAASAKPDVDAHLMFHIDGVDHTLPCEIKTSVDRRDQLLRYKVSHPSAVLIAPLISDTMAQECRELGIQFVDYAGNCFLRQPGLHIFVTGVRGQERALASQKRGLTPAALHVMLVLLTQPPALRSNVRHIAALSSVSHGAAGAALVTFDELGLLTRGKGASRLLAHPERWLDAWTEGYLGRIRPRLKKQRMSAAVSMSTLIEQASPAMYEVALGGEVAAACLGLGLKPAALTLYVKLDDPQVMRGLVHDLKLRSDANGQVELIDMFWNAQALPSFPTVPDALVYADLIGTGDERAMEIARDLKKRICAQVVNEAY